MDNFLPTTSSSTQTPASKTKPPKNLPMRSLILITWRWFLYVLVCLRQRCLLRLYRDNSHIVQFFDHFSLTCGASKEIRAHVFETGSTQFGYLWLLVELGWWIGLKIKYLVLWGLKSIWNLGRGFKWMS